MDMNEELSRYLRKMEGSLRHVVDEDFVTAHKHLTNKYTDADINEVFRLCLISPGGKSWSPVWQVMLLLYQAAFSESYTTEPNRFMTLGNYLIHKLPKGSKPVVYSFGIGNDITFDKAAADLYDVPIHMYDPTPGVAVFMEQFKDDKRLKFTQEGVFTEETEIKLYTSDVPGKLNSSLYPIHGKNGNYVMVRCRPLEDFVKANGHDHIDILKMDVEGVADDVLLHMIDKTDIRPKQIVAEFEVKQIENPITYLPKLITLMSKLMDNGYKIYNQLLTRKASIELIIVHQSLYDAYTDK